MSAGSRWEAVIGLEVHVQLATASKLFCRCEARFGAPPNTLVCPVCTAQPGALPTLNAAAVRLGALAGLALGCKIDERLRFERKHYVYPDLPKGYQITQLARPLCSGGALRVEGDDGEVFEVSIPRAHLEEDAGKIVHPDGGDGVHVDLNRAGTPLLEIVSGPDLRSPEQALAYLKTLRRTLRDLGVSRADMEKGGFRCDVNVSLRPRGDELLGTRTETKNLNSFRFVAGAIGAEIARQTERLEAGGTVVQQTLGYDPKSGRTHPLRDKEDARDYRYLPEPDLPDYVIKREDVEALRASLPEAPEVRRARFVGEWDLPVAEAEALVAERALAEFFEAVARASERPRQSAHWVLNECLRLCKEQGVGIAELSVRPERVAELVGLVTQGLLSVAAGRVVLRALAERPEAAARQLAEELDLLQQSDGAALAKLVEQLLSAEQDLVRRYREGDTAVLDALLGSAMKAGGGKTNPSALRALLLEKLGAAD